MKHFTPLESSPEIFTDLAHDLGLATNVRFEDVFELSPSQLPESTFALILIFPTSEPYEALKLREDGERQPFPKDNDILWVKQTVNNACGLYAMIHAICNGEAKQYVRPDSWLAKLLELSISDDSERAISQYIESSSELERLYSRAAQQGDTRPPEDPATEVDFHYVCFTKSTGGLGIYELDGDRAGPLLKGSLPESDSSIAHENVLDVVRRSIGQTGCTTMFNLMALGRRR